MRVVSAGIGEVWHTHCLKAGVLQEYQKRFNSMHNARFMPNFTCCPDTVQSSTWNRLYTYASQQKAAEQQHTFAASLASAGVQ
jgi:hypothetical protein